MAYDSNNIFARILRGEIPCKKVYEDQWLLAFEDVAPSAPTHVLAVPKGEFTSFDDFARQATPEFMHGFFSGIQKIVVQLGLENGYRLITNHGQDAGQSVAHFHVHLIGGRNLGGLLP